MKLNSEFITREADWSLLLWVRQEECGRAANRATIQLTLGFRWVTEPCSETSTHHYTARLEPDCRARQEDQFMWCLPQRWTKQSEVCTRANRKHILSISAPSSTLGGSRKSFFTCSDPTEIREHSDSKITILYITIHFCIIIDLKDTLVLKHDGAPQYRIGFHSEFYRSENAIPVAVWKHSPVVFIHFPHGRSL